MSAGEWVVRDRVGAGARVVRNPAVLPAAVSQFSLRLEPHSTMAPQPFEGIELPVELHDALPSRQVQFRAGRFCALAALQALDPACRPASLPRGRHGAPVWPVGFSGSITHTDDFVSAAVARTTTIASVGIDSERIFAAARARAIGIAVSWPSETAVVRTIGCDRLEALTLVFSAKEALFKCLHARVGRLFSYHEARLVAIDARSRTFRIRLVTSLAAELPAGTVLDGRFDLDNPWIHTGMALPHAAAAGFGDDIAVRDTGAVSRSGISAGLSGRAGFSPARP